MEEKYQDGTKTGNDFAGSVRSVWSLAERELGLEKDGLVNIGWLCSDRICNDGNGQRIALHFERYDGYKRNYSFDDLRISGNTFGGFLNYLGIKDGDRICLYLDRVPELYFAFLGILKIGAVVQPLFSAFGPESLMTRLNDSKARAVITQSRHLGKIRKIRDDLPGLEYIVIIDPENVKSTEHKEIPFEFDKAPAIQRINIFPTKAASESVLHYTSGTTGKPKGVLHAHQSVISQYFTAKSVLDIQNDDIYWCTADPGWVTGISYGIIGPWSLGATQCVLDAGFSARNWYGFIERYNISNWYTSPTAIRSLMKAGGNIAGEYDLSSLRHLSSVGEPLNPEGVKWSERVFGTAFHDTYWQTETGSIMVANMPGMQIKPGSMGKPVPGITSAILDIETFELLTEHGKAGLLAFMPDWSAMMKGYWGDPHSYGGKFVNGWYITGDKAFMDKDGYYWFIGRNDDIINTGGHLVSPFEVESALLEHPAVAESAVISKPDEINMEVVKACIILKPGFPPDDNTKLEIMNFIRKRLSSIAMPNEIEFLEKLPKTRSGKILRRVLRAKAWGKEMEGNNENNEELNEND